MDTATAPLHRRLFRANAFATRLSRESAASCAAMQGAQAMRGGVGNYGSARSARVHAARGVVAYAALRILRALVTVWGVVTLVFLLVHLMPGDPIDAILGDQASQEDRVALRRALRLDQPLSS